MPGLFESLFGSSGKMKRASTKTKTQQKALEDYLKKGIETTPLYGAGSNFLQSLLSNEPGAFEAFQAPYMQQFQQQIAPGIAERFSGMGTGAGAQSSSALNQALASAGGNLQNQLASLRSGLQMQALPQALNYAQQPYSNQLAGIGMNTFENVYQPGSQGLVAPVLAGAAGGFSGGMGLGLSNFLGNKFFGPQPGQAGGIG